MPSYLLTCFALTASLAICQPAIAQSKSTGGGGGGYEEQGQDHGYDNMKADTKTTPSTDELATGAALAKQGKFGEAIPHLELAQAKKPRDVTVLIYLGFAHRMVATDTPGDARNAEFKKALDYYQQALAIDPDNKLVHEYLGKLYLLMREYTLASNELKTLETLCDSQCAERAALAQAVAANPPPPAQTSGPAAQPAPKP